MASKRRDRQAIQRAGNAGLIASVVIALAGVILGAAAAYVGKFGAIAAANRSAPIPSVNVAEIAVPETTGRETVVRRMIEQFPLERFAVEAPVIAESAAPRPKIVIILDDIGLDPEAAERAFSLPGPISFSILPYAESAQALAEKAAAGDGDVMLHLPMEPHGDEDPGPNALRSDMSAGIFLRALQWNLSRFDNYVGVNNHMGSKLTANSAAMKTILGALKDSDIYFIDSVTSKHSVAYSTGLQIGADILPRDVFLDPTPDSRDIVRRQLRLVEQIAMETGYVVAIGHPRPETLDVLGPWLTSVRARGFELTTPSALLAKPKPAMVATASPQER